MKLAIITTRTSGYFPNRRLLEEGKARGHEVELWNPYRIYPLLGEPGGPSAMMDRRPVTADLALPRVGSQIGDFGCAAIEQLELMGIKVINRAVAVRLARNKFLALQACCAAGLPVPRLAMVSTPESFAAAVKRLGGRPVVAKELSSRQGRGVILVNDDQTMDLVTGHLLDQRTGLLVQRFIPPRGRRDFRLFVLGSRVVAAAELAPKQGDFRANFHLTGEGKVYEPTARLSKLAVKAAKTLGLDIAGVDMMLDAEERPWLVEVNYAPGFRGLEMMSGLNLAGMLWDFMEGAR